jgi:lipid-A-disaccharide synthase
MLLIFPFEEDIYRQAGIPATYVGHPLAHALPNRRIAKSRARRLVCKPTLNMSC